MIVVKRLMICHLQLKKGKPNGEFKDGSADNPFLNPPYPKLSELVAHIIKLENFWNSCTTYFELDRGVIVTFK